MVFDGASNSATNVNVALPARWPAPEVSIRDRGSIPAARWRRAAGAPRHAHHHRQSGLQAAATIHPDRARRRQQFQPTCNGTATLGGNGTVVVTPQLGHYAAGTFIDPDHDEHAHRHLRQLDRDGDHSFAATLDSSPTSERRRSRHYGQRLSLLATPAGANQNQQNVLNGINNAILAGRRIPTGFSISAICPARRLLNALTQLDGQDGDRRRDQRVPIDDGLFESVDRSVDGGGGQSDRRRRAGLCAGTGREPAVGYRASLCGDPDKAPPAQQQNFDQRWSAWGAAFGGAGKLDGDPTVGSNSVTASDYGYAAGMDYHATPNSVYGFALSGGGTNWSVAQNLGSGRSDSFQLGVHDTTHWGPVYLSGALAFANHWFTTNRTAVGDQLQAKFDGQSYAVRGEAGYRYAVPVTGAIIGVTPYAALQVQDFHTQGFSETDLTGGGFGLSFAAQNATDTRSELGARFDNLQVVDGMPLVLRARLAWAHDWVVSIRRSARYSRRCPDRTSPSTARRCRKIPRSPPRRQSCTSMPTGRRSPNSTASSPRPRRLTPAPERCATVGKPGSSGNRSAMSGCGPSLTSGEVRVEFAKPR